MIRRANSWRELGEGGATSSFGVPMSPQWADLYSTDPHHNNDAGEQPIFTTKAHVFQIDAGTKKDWIPASKSAVSVSYYYDSTRNSYRIISVDGSKAIVNSTITPNMTFTKTSQKFGQWSDPRANTVYGLGFATEVELTKFIEKFKEIKELTRQAAQQKVEVNGGVTENHAPSPQPSPNRQSLHQRTNSLSSIQGSNGLASNTAEAQLKYENDRLKLALAQSSANAKKWEVELSTLKNNNARLTAALQESTANVEEWKKQLAAYKEESSRLKKRVAEMESGGGGDGRAVSQMTEQLDRLKLDSHNKQEEIARLTAQLQDLMARENLTTSLQARIQSLEEENHTVTLRLQDCQRQLQECRGSREQEGRELLRLQEALGARITELYEVHENIVATMKRESSS